MRRICGLALIALLGGAAAGCATMTVGSHVERGLDFSRYRTFDWGAPDELPTGDARLDANPFFKDRLQGAVEQQLAHRGLAMSASPDLRIHYHASVTKRLDVSRVDRQRGYCSGDGCGAEVREYEAGTIVLDIVDTHTNQVIRRGWAQDRLVWRGWTKESIDGVIDYQDRLEERIDKAVFRIVAQLPRKG
jgi:hypothetical protein